MVSCLFVQLNSVQTLVGLLSHENSDIALAVVDVLQEMTDVDTVNESEEEAETLIEALLSEQVIRASSLSVCVCVWCGVVWCCVC